MYIYASLTSSYIACGAKDNMLSLEPDIPNSGCVTS